MNSRRIVLLAVVAVVLVGWYLFRPERIFLDRIVDEQPVVADVLARGTFRGVAHNTSGQAIWQVQEDGTQVLRLEGFETSDGPLVEVYLVAAEDAPDNHSVTRSGFISLGPLKGNIGSQNYVIPPGTDVTKYRCVSIWCSRFSVNFGVASLQPGP